MKMSYTTNEKIAEIRARAVNMVRSGTTTRKVARHFGYSQSAVVKWCIRAPRGIVEDIPTRSSAPHTSPSALPEKTVGRIIHARVKSKRCAEVVHELLKNEGVTVSLSSVKRTLSRFGLLKRRSLWKRRRVYPPRPEATKPGMLVQMDTIHFVDKHGTRTYVYTALDVHSRYGFAILSTKANCHRSIVFLKKAVTHFPFRVQTIQTDNGPEFGLHFTDCVTRNNMTHRHIHPRSPNENGHLERFNRTIQEEIGRHGLCIFIPRDISLFLRHYNNERLHMGINFKTPAQLITK